MVQPALQPASLLQSQPGRFLTPDPIKLAGGLNHYQYVPNPTGWVDPLGLNNCPGSDGRKPREGDDPAALVVPYENIPVLPDAEPGVYLYRGVYKGHPAEGDAQKGRVVPGRVNGDVTPETHNRGGVSAESPYTSWTHSPSVARSWAREGGLVLRVRVGAPRPGDGWSWTMSEDIWGEREVLLKGVREGDIEVFRP